MVARKFNFFNLQFKGRCSLIVIQYILWSVVNVCVICKFHYFPWNAPIILFFEIFSFVQGKQPIKILFKTVCHFEEKVET